MKIGDYISQNDVTQLSLEEFEAFRNYVRFLGHPVHPGVGMYRSAGHAGDLLMLSPLGHLAWVYNSALLNKGNQISLEEIRQITALFIQES